VGRGGFELPTFRLSVERSSRAELPAPKLRMRQKLNILWLYKNCHKDFLGNHQFKQIAPYSLHVEETVLAVPQDWLRAGLCFVFCLFFIGCFGVGYGVFHHKNCMRLC
jgi:hypothetical protein